VNLEPLVGDAADGRRDSVFVSYSHRDKKWAQRFEEMLNPPILSGRLRLWFDVNLRVGDQWHPNIFRAIARSSVALLLVSADFLSSRFIMQQEMHALVAQRVRLAPVLVGDCMWKEVHHLASVQWLFDPGRGPLNVIKQRGLQDQRLREICDQLIKVAPDARRSGTRDCDAPLPPANSVYGYDPPLPPANSVYGYDPPLPPADSVYGYDPPLPPADSVYGYDPPLPPPDSVSGYD
jgi:hypothetical protein